MGKTHRWWRAHTPRGQRRANRDQQRTGEAAGATVWTTADVAVAQKFLVAGEDGGHPGVPGDRGRHLEEQVFAAVTRGELDADREAFAALADREADRRVAGDVEGGRERAVLEDAAQPRRP